MQYQKLPPIFNGSKISLLKLAQNQEFLFKLDTSLPWMQTLLEELNSNLDEESLAQIVDKGSLSADISIKKKLDDSLQENLIFHGNVETTFHTHCVRCLDPMKQTLQVDIKACFLPRELMNRPEYQDQITIYAFNEELELYFYQKKEVDLEEFFREQLYLNVDTIPLHTEDCKGLCQVCGINLNRDCCSHNSSVSI